MADSDNATRRGVIGGMAAMPSLSALSGIARAEDAKTFKIYGVYTGTDLKSYMCELEIAGEEAVIPTFQVLAPGGAGLPVDGSWQDYHISTVFGSMTVMLDGELELGVTAGSLRTALAKAGDIYIMIDTQGDGHSAMRKGNVPTQIINARFVTTAEGLWPALKRAFKGWPDNVLPPKEYAPYASVGTSDPSRRFPSKPQ
jgi:hypothetical protein